MTTTTGRGLAVTGPKLIYTDDEKHAYAFSGWLAVATGADTLLLDFTTNQHPTEITLYWGFNYDLLENGKYFGIDILLNGVRILRPRAEQRISGSGHGTELVDEIKFIIPPTTRCVINAQTDDGGTEAGCMIVGLVYG